MADERTRTITLTDAEAREAVQRIARDLQNETRPLSKHPHAAAILDALGDPVCVSQKTLDTVIAGGADDRTMTLTVPVWVLGAALRGLARLKGSEAELATYRRAGLTLNSLMRDSHIDD